MASKHTVNLNLRVRQTAPVPLEIAAPCTLADLRLLVEAASGYPAAGQKLVYAGRVLAAALDDTNEDAVDVVATYGMRDGGTLYVVPAVVAPPIPSAASMVPNGGGSSSAAALRDDRGMQADMMRTLAGSPFVEAMLANPAFVESLIMANPQMRALAEASPEVARMLRDPATLRQMFRAARDPRAMEHMQRSNDRALANLESVPGAMAQVHRLYNSTLSAADAAGSGSGSPTSSAGSSAATQEALRNSQLAGALGVSPVTPGTLNTAALPNPWAAPAAASPTSSTPSPVASARPSSAATAMQAMMQPRVGAFASASGAAALPTAPWPRPSTVRAPQPPSQPQQQQQQRYPVQLAHMIDMGFPADACERALARTAGDIDEAVAAVVADMDEAE